MSFGEPEDVPGDCNARLYIGDNFGDGHATMRCGLPASHEGLHCETYSARNGGQVTVTWEKCERQAEADQEAETAAAVCCRCGHLNAVHTRLVPDYSADGCAERGCQCAEFDWPNTEPRDTKQEKVP